MNIIAKNILCFIGSLLLASAAFAQGYSNDVFTIAGGGGTVTGGAYSISGAVGQPDGNLVLSGGGFSITGGFWSIVGTVAPAAPPLLVSAVEKIGNDLRLGFTSVAGKNYTIQSCGDLSSAAWTDRPGVSTPGTGGTIQVTLTNAFDQPRQFYRVKQSP